LIELVVAVLAFLATYMRISSVSVKFLRWLLALKRKSSLIGNCARTSDYPLIRNMKLLFILPRHWIDNLPHLDSLCSSAQAQGIKKLFRVDFIFH
jgi:hypothetical protein